MPGPVELKNKRVLVVGVARTGIATAQFCAARGAIVTATDSRSEAEIGDAAGKLREVGVKLVLGGHGKNIFAQQKQMNGFCRELYINIDMDNPGNNITEVKIGIN